MNLGMKIWNQMKSDLKKSHMGYIHMSQYILYTLSVDSRVGVVRCQGWGGQGAEGGHRLIPAPLLRDEDRHHCAPFMYIYIQIFLSVPWNFSRAQAPESTFKCLRWAWADFQFSAYVCNICQWLSITASNFQMSVFFVSITVCYRTHSVFLHKICIL